MSPFQLGLFWNEEYCYLTVIVYLHCMLTNRSVNAELQTTMGMCDSWLWMWKHICGIIYHWKWVRSHDGLTKPFVKEKKKSFGNKRHLSKTGSKNWSRVDTRIILIGLPPSKLCIKSSKVKQILILCVDRSQNCWNVIVGIWSWVCK